MDSSATTSTILVADTLSHLQALKDQVIVSLSNELVKLLSEQLYQSPLKAIEELVVNAYDADATNCWVFVETSGPTRFILVFDDGTGMSSAGLADLWQIGRSGKRTPEVEARFKRKQIGKFGIGKLASYTIAEKLTHISKSAEGILSVTVNFNDFVESGSGSGTPIPLSVHRIDDLSAFAEIPNVKRVFSKAGIDPNKLAAYKTWTIALLESLKPKATEMSIRDLNWILRTAMPLRTDFSLFLNGGAIASSKEDFEAWTKFSLGQIIMNPGNWTTKRQDLR